MILIAHWTTNQNKVLGTKITQLPWYAKLFPSITMKTIRKWDSELKSEFPEGYRFTEIKWL